VKSDCCDTGCQSPTSSEVIHHQEKDEEQEAQKNLSLTTQRLFSLPVDLPRRTGELLGGDFEVTTKLPLTLKLNGFVTQLDEGPLDLSLGRRRDSAGGARSSRRSDRKQPEALSTDSRLRSCTKSQAASLTSASLAKLVKRFGGALTSNSALGEKKLSSLHIICFFSFSILCCFLMGLVNKDYHRSAAGVHYVNWLLA